MEARDKTALVLGAGGVFGAYQVGVWKALADSFQPDLVVGASIGSINGWMIAGGCTPQELEQMWLNADKHLRLRLRFPRRWWQGCFDIGSMESAITEIFNRYTPRIEYAAVVTDFWRMKPRLFTAEQMTCRHMLASCAVPGVYDLRRLEGRMCADGGILAALPLWAAAELGATRIVGVHSLPDPPQPLRLLRSAVRRLSRFRPRDGPEPDIIQIGPEQPLGSFLELLRYRRDRIQAWIEQGERDALKVKHSISKCFERQF
jgi:NTE family protein